MHVNDVGMVPLSMVWLHAVFTCHDTHQTAKVTHYFKSLWKKRYDKWSSLYNSST